MNIKNWSELNLVSKILVIILCAFGSCCIFVAMFLGCQHSYNDFTISKEATCTQTGEKVLICTKCGEKQIRTISMVEHKSSDWIIDLDATCENEGKKHKTCVTCGITMMEEPIQDLGGHILLVSKLENGGKIGSTISYSCSECDYSIEKTVLELDSIFSKKCIDKNVINGCLYCKVEYTAEVSGGFGSYQYEFLVYDLVTEKVVEEYTKHFSSENFYIIDENDIDKFTETYKLVLNVKDDAGNVKSFEYTEENEKSRP